MPPAAAQSPIPLRVAGHFSQNSRQADGIERPFYTGLDQIGVSANLDQCAGM